MQKTYSCTLLSAMLLACAPTWAEEPPAAVRAQIESCAACHGEAGAKPIAPEYPIIAGQHEYYIYVQLKDFAAGRRENEVMKGIASALDKEQMKQVANWFSKQKWPAHSQDVSGQSKSKAMAVLNAGECVVCHLGNFQGTSGVPRTAGQNVAYLKKTLLDFKHRRRNNAPDKGTLMATYEDADLEAVAEYFGSLR